MTFTSFIIVVVLLVSAPSSVRSFQLLSPSSRDRGVRRSSIGGRRFIISIIGPSQLGERPTRKNAVEQDEILSFVESSPSSSPSPSSSRSMKSTTAIIYDTTLRDGTQMESISVSCDDKLKITNQLADFGMDYIEAGWPGSNPKDEEYFRRAHTELDVSTFDRLVAFGSTRRKNVAAREDGQLRALLDSRARTICIVAKAHLWQVTDILRADPDENINMIYDSVSYLVSRGRAVMVDLEHYFDGYNFNAEYATKCCQAAVDGGASVLVLCDTNGGSMPWNIEHVCTETLTKFANTAASSSSSSSSSSSITIPTFGIHCHNDCGPDSPYRRCTSTWRIILCIVVVLMGRESLCSNLRNYTNNNTTTQLHGGVVDLHHRPDRQASHLA